VSSTNPPPFGGAILIADKSAWVSGRKPAARQLWTDAFQRGQIATCSVVALELLYSAQNSADFASIEADLASIENFSVGPAEFEAAIDAMRTLAQNPLDHRIPLPDYLIAATAQNNGVGVLHYDKDYVRLATVMSFDSQLIAPLGSI
jgi:predicted nucleic acid-binding protein